MRCHDYLSTSSNLSQKVLYSITFIDKLRHNTFMLQTRNIRIISLTKYKSIFRLSLKC